LGTERIRPFRSPLLIGIFRIALPSLILIVLLEGSALSILKVSIRQVKAARALLAWSQHDLAAEAGVSVPTVKRLEAADGPLGGRAKTTQKLQAALERGGIDFIEENGSGPGVRLRKRQRPKQLR